MIRASEEREDLLKKLQESTDAGQQLILRVLLMDKEEQQRLLEMVNDAFPIRAVTSIPKGKEKKRPTEFFASYRPEDHREPALHDYMEELQLQIKEPLKLMHEMLMRLGEDEPDSIDSDNPIFQYCMNALWVSLERWDCFDRHFEADVKRARRLRYGQKVAQAA